MLLNIRMARVICLCFGVQEEGVLEHTNVTCRSVQSYRSVCRPLCNINIPHHSTIKHTQAEILVSTLERQVS